MHPINHYTISGIESLKRFPNMEIAQFTLNSRIWPGNRKTVDALRSVKPYHKSRVLVHYDFIYILSRYAMFSFQTKQAILRELIDIMSYANFDKTILGIVMHMDWSLKKGITAVTDSLKIKDSYQGTVWDSMKIPDLVKDHYNNWLEFNLSQFVSDLEKTVPFSWAPGCKIYLENTTKVGPSKEGTFRHLVSIIENNPGYKKYFGIVLDTEHYFAVEGVFPDVIASKPGDIDYIVHLNVIPPEVKPKSGKDRHSENTIFECSLFKDIDYRTMALALIHNNIPFVREVKEDTMFREIKQMKEQWLPIQ